MRQPPNSYRLERGKEHQMCSVVIGKDWDSEPLFASTAMLVGIGKDGPGPRGAAELIEKGTALPISSIFRTG
jgi:hypothetical protein